MLCYAALESEMTGCTSLRQMVLSMASVQGLTEESLSSHLIVRSLSLLLVGGMDRIIRSPSSQPPPTELWARCQRVGIGCELLLIGLLCDVADN